MSVCFTRAFVEKGDKIYAASNKPISLGEVNGAGTSQDMSPNLSLTAWCF